MLALKLRPWLLWLNLAGAKEEFCIFPDEMEGRESPLHL